MCAEYGGPSCCEHGKQWAVAGVRILPCTNSSNGVSCVGRVLILSRPHALTDTVSADISRRHALLAVSQAASPESNCDSPLPVKATETVSSDISRRHALTETVS